MAKACHLPHYSKRPLCLSDLAAVCMHWGAMFFHIIIYKTTKRISNKCGIRNLKIVKQRSFSPVSLFITTLLKFYFIRQSKHFSYIFLQK